MSSGRERAPAAPVDRVARRRPRRARKPAGTPRSPQRAAPLPDPGLRVTGVHLAGRVLGGSATAPGWKRPAVPARVRPSPAAVRDPAAAAGDAPHPMP